MIIGMNNQCKSQVLEEDIWHNSFAPRAMELVIALLLYRGKYLEAKFDDDTVVNFDQMKIFFLSKQVLHYRPLRLMRVLRQREVNAHACMQMHLRTLMCSFRSPEEEHMIFRGDL